jgi:integrase
MGETARTHTSPERAGRVASSLAHKLQGIRFKRVPPSATQEMEGLNRPDNNRTNWNTFDSGIRELRIGRSHRGSTAEGSRRQGALALAERGKPPSLGLKRDLQDGPGGRDRQGNPAGSLLTPKEAKTRAKRTMTKEQVRLALSVLDLRERIIFLLAVLVGMRPGEILALRWARVDSQMIEIAQRVYRGLPDDPKTERGKRQAALPPDLAGEVDGWRDISPDTGPEALVFPLNAARTCRVTIFCGGTFRRKLDKTGLGWVNFQVLRRTQVSLGHKEGVDPKVAADQRGHAIGVAIDTYSESGLESRREAVTRLEDALAGRKPAKRAAAAEDSSELFEVNEGSLVSFRPVSILVLIKGRWGLGYFTRAQHEQAYLCSPRAARKNPSSQLATSSSGMTFRSKFT